MIKEYFYLLEFPPEFKIDHCIKTKLFYIYKNVLDFGFERFFSLLWIKSIGSTFWYTKLHTRVRFSFGVDWKNWMNSNILIRSYCLMRTNIYFFVRSKSDKNKNAEKVELSNFGLIWSGLYNHSKSLSIIVFGFLYFISFELIIIIVKKFIDMGPFLKLSFPRKPWHGIHGKSIRSFLFWEKGGGVNKKWIWNFCSTSETLKLKRDQEKSQFNLRQRKRLKASNPWEREVKGRWLNHSERQASYRWSWRDLIKLSLL